MNAWNQPSLLSGSHIFFASRPTPPAVLPGINNCQHLVVLPNKRMTEWGWRSRGGGGGGGTSINYLLKETPRSLFVYTDLKKKKTGSLFMLFSPFSSPSIALLVNYHILEGGTGVGGGAPKIIISFGATILTSKIFVWHRFESTVKSSKEIKNVCVCGGGHDDDSGDKTARA